MRRQKKQILDSLEAMREKYKEFLQEIELMPNQMEANFPE